jgi:hypothetical protein
MGAGKQKVAKLQGNLNAVTQGKFIQLAKRYIDGRTTLAKQLKQIKQELISDLGGDPSTAQMLLVDRIKFKAMQLYFYEMAIASGNSEMSDRYIALSNSLRLDLTSLGLKRREKEILDLKGYLKNKYEK